MFTFIKSITFVSRIKSLVFFVIAQDYFQLTPLWKPQILLKQLYTVFIGARFATLRSKPFDLLVFFYLFVSVALMLTQLFQYAVLSHRYAFLDLFLAQYPLLMAFSVLLLYGPAERLGVGLLLRVVNVLVGINVLLNLLLALTGLEDRLAAAYDIFEFSFNQNIVVFFLFLQAAKLYHSKAAKIRHGFSLLALLCLINVPNFQRARFILILFILSVFFLRKAAWSVRVFLAGLCAAAVFLIFKTEKFSTVLEALSTKEEAVDPSLAGRFIQVQQILATDFNPLYGFGFLNAKTKDSFFDETYFHPSDTGVFGIYFNGGYMGLLLYFLLFAIALREVQKHNRQGIRNDPDPEKVFLKQAAILMVCFILLNSIFTASLFYDPMFLVSYLYLLKRF